MSFNPETHFPAEKGFPPEKDEGITPENAASRQRIAEAGEHPVIIYDQPWLSSLVRPLLIIILVSCCVFVFVTLVKRLIPTLPDAAANSILILAILGATASTVSTTILAQPNQRMQRTAGYRIAELGILLAIARLLLWLVYRGFPPLNDLITTPFSAIFDGVYWAALIIITLAWSVASEITSDLQRLALQADELYVAQHHHDRLGEIARTSGVDRPAILNSFAIRWVSMGILMLFLSAIVRVGLPQQTSMRGVFGILRQQIEAGVAVAIIVYFLCGLLLIGVSQLALLRSRWTLDKTPMRSSILKNWPTYVIGLVGLVAIVSALMPLGDTFLLAKIINFIIGAVLTVAMTIMQLFMGLLMLIFSAFGGESTAPLEMGQTAAPVVMPTPQPQQEPILPAWTGGAIFWIVMAILLGNAALIYFGGKHLNISWLRWLWQMLHLRWRSFTESFDRWQRERLPQLRTKSQKVSDESSLWDRPIDPDTLSPLEQVRYYYLSLLRSAEKAGHARAKSETPIRYAPRLSSAIDSISGADQPVSDSKTQEAAELTQNDKKIINDEIDLLTKNFVNTRYAGNKADAQTLTQLRQAWKSLQNRLHKL